MMQAPVTVLQTNTRRDSGRKAQLGNIMVAKSVADIVRTTLGPRAMLKMLLDANGSLVLTNDGNAILREIDVSHPAAKSIIELSRTQAEEVGDGTTSVIILAGEMLQAAEPFLQRSVHATVIIRAYLRALEDALRAVDEAAFAVDVNNRDAMLNVVGSCIGTKFANRFGSLLPRLALDAVLLISGGFKAAPAPSSAPDASSTAAAAERAARRAADFDYKKWARVEKIPGASVEDSRVLRGVMFEKDVVVPSRMRRSIPNPRILLLDCPLEYKKGENQANVELAREEDFAALLAQEEAWTRETCAAIAALKPDLVITEKGLSDLASHFLCKAGISAIRRVRKTDNNRLARACGATVVSRAEEATEADLGCGAGLFEVRKVADEFWTVVEDCADPRACTVVLRGASRDVLNELERNLEDALGVACAVALDPRLVPGGGAVEMAVARALADRVDAGEVAGAEAGPYRAVAAAMEIIPRTLAANCGAKVIRVLSELRAQHAASKKRCHGVNGNSGQVEDMKAAGVWEPYVVKTQTLKTAIEAATLLLRIDDIVSGLKKRDRGGAGPQQPQADAGENVDSEMMLPE